MSPKAEKRCRIALTLAGAATFLVLAICEVLASHGVSPVSDNAPWALHVEAVDEALARQDLSVAVRAWHAAYSAALGSRRWTGMADVGDAYLRIGEAAGLRKPWEPRAREVYLNALLRARHEGSLDGVLRVAGAFAALGDTDVVEGALRIAERLATKLNSRDQVRAARERLMTRMLATGAGAPRVSMPEGRAD